MNFLPKFKAFDHDLQQTIKTGRLSEHDPNACFYAEKGGGTTITTEVPEPTPEETRYREAQAEYAEEIMPMEAEYYTQRMEMERELMPLYRESMEAQLGLVGPQVELAEMNLERARRIAAGEPLATPEQQQALRQMADLYKTETRAGVEEAAEELTTRAGQARLARGMPYADLGYEKEIGKYVTKEIGRSERAAETLYQQGLVEYPAAAAQLGQMLAQGQVGGYGVPGGGYAMPGGGQVQAPGGMNVLTQMISELKGERYGQATTTQGPGPYQGGPFSSTFTRKIGAGVGKTGIDFGTWFGKIPGLFF